MIPAFVIHHTSSKDRIDLVEKIVKETGAIRFQSVWLDDHKLGCMRSHIGVAKLAKSLYPTQSYLVFEDDCELYEGWRDLLNTTADIVYLGYNDKSTKVIYGTHALYITPKMRDIIIADTERVKDDVIDKRAFDHILSKLIVDHMCSMSYPSYDVREKYCKQSRGLRSTITGKIRV